MNDDIWLYLLGDNFLVPVWTFLSSNVAKFSLNIVKYRSTQISKVFDKYRQISLRFMTDSVEFQTISKDAVSERKLQVSKISVMRVRWESKVRFLEIAQASFSDFSETINRGVFSNEDQALCENS